MAGDKSKMIRLGLFVILAIILFTIGVYNVGSKKNLFGSNFHISTEFKDIKGLLAGSNVRYSGLLVGAVESIMMVNDTLIRVDMSINTSYKTHIRKNAIAHIASSGLVGEMLINIIPSSESAPFVEEGDLLKSSESVQTQQMLSTLDRTNENFLDISQNLRELTEQLNSKSGFIKTTLNSEALSTSIHKSTKNIETISNNLRETSKDISKLIDQIEEGKGALGYLMRDSSFAIRTDQIIADVDDKVIQKTEPILSKLDEASTNIMYITGRVDSLVRQIDYEDNLLGFLLKDSSAVYRTKSLMDSIQISTELLNENLEALQHNFLFKRYFKKKRKRELKANSD